MAAELTAAKTVNSDLKENIRWLERDVAQGDRNREGSLKMINQLWAKYEEVGGNFEAFIQEAEENKVQLEQDLSQLKERIWTKGNENDDLKKEIEANERNIASVQQEIESVTTDIDSIRDTNEKQIWDLEQTRIDNEETINDLKT